jgi:RNA polymerase sigma-70 factor (ECF subfamily)
MPHAVELDPRDDALLAAAARTDPDAFAALYRRYLNPIHRYCALRLGSRQLAEDATSQVFLEALADLPKFRGGAFAGWLFRIAQHTVADMQRQRRRSGTAVPIDVAGELMDEQQGPDDIAIAHSEEEALRLALAMLPADQRAAIELQLAGWSSEQIGRALGRSPGAVRILRFRALQRLRAILTSAGAEPGRGDAAC